MTHELNPIAQHNLRRGAEPNPHLNLVDPIEAFCEVCGLHYDAGPLGFGTAGCPGCNPTRTPQSAATEEELRRESTTHRQQ